MVKEKSKSQKRRGWKIVLIIFIVLAIILGVVYFYFSYKIKQNSVFLNVQNTDLYNVIARFGLSDAVVDISDERIVVSYNLENLSQKNEALFLTLGAAYQISPDSKKIIIVEFYKLVPVEEVSIFMSDVKLYAESQLSEEELVEKMKIKKIESK